MSSNVDSAKASALANWRWRRSAATVRRREQPAPGPKPQPAEQPAWLYWRWDTLAAQKAKRPIRAVVDHPSRLG